ncbi:unnamed protein product [Paramecium pentaurelia]|uniref:Uncharacterized protein n=1 Tax=Paramecium pentaurelia TaxID=43138 RepID=A0A8S1XKZ9_9CILI|nr:unnamed protein product [Paramecium pentaurelia]
MNILEEIKKQVEVEMKKIKKTSPSVVKKPLNLEQKKELIDLTNQGIQLKDAAKQLQMGYHEAKITLNEYKRKALSTQSETESAVYNVRFAGVSNLKQYPRHFILQSSVNNKLVSVRRLYNIVVQNPLQS